MKRRTLLHRMGGLPLLFPAIARAQPANRVRTVGVTFANLGDAPAPGAGGPVARLSARRASRGAAGGAA